VGTVTTHKRTVAEVARMITLAQFGRGILVG
jgi:hypothetical protein